MLLTIIGVVTLGCVGRLLCGRTGLVVGGVLALLAASGCDDSAYQGHSCLSNDNCQPLFGAGIDYACSAVTLTCAHGVSCSEDSDCSNNFACSSPPPSFTDGGAEQAVGQCSVACNSDSDCALGFHCSGETNTYGLGGTCLP